MIGGKTFPITFLLGAKGKPSQKLAAEATAMQKAAAKIGGAGKALTVGVTAPLLALGGAATRNAANFGDSMSNISTVIDTDKESIDAMGSEVLRIGRRTPVALGDLSAALYDVRSAGIGAGEQFKVLEKSAQLGVAGLGTTAEAADIATSAINAFNLKGEKADKVYSQVFATTQVGKTTIAQLAQGFGSVAGTVAATGTELDEYLSAVAALTTTGLPASEAHTQLKAVISGLTRETKLGSKVFRALGAKDLPQLIEKSGGLVPALQAISDKLGGNKTKMLEVLGSTEALNAAIGLTGNQAEAQKNALELMRGEGDLLAEAFAKKSNSSSAKFQRMANKIEASSIRIGNALLPTVERIAGKVEALTDWFDGLDEGTKDWVVSLGMVAAAVGPVLIGLSTMIQLGTTVKATVVALTAAKTAAAGAATTGAAANATLGASYTALLGPLAAVAAAVGAVALAYDQYQKLDSELGEVGVGGTIGSMLHRGTLDPFEAYDAAADDAARARANERASKERVAGLLNSGPGGPLSPQRRAGLLDGLVPPAMLADGPAASGSKKSETEVKVSFANAPPGTRAQTTKSSGDAYVELAMGISMGGG